MAVASLRVIAGPTAAGKSALALALAQRFPLTIISADSRQVYRGFDIGTAKPTAAEQALVPHRGIDLVEPAQRYSAAAWSAAVDRWTAECETAERVPLVVGGTGFYVRTLVAPLFDEPPLEVDRRRALMGALEKLSTEELRRWCRVLDPDRARLGRTQLLRAAEMALLTGVPISEWYRRSSGAPRHVARYLVLDPGAALHDRIEARARQMLEAGWEAEVAALMTVVPPDAPAWNASGYAAVRELVRGGLVRSRALERIIIDTRQYAKRQRTWFRQQLRGASVTLLDPTRPDALDRAVAWWTCNYEESQ